MQSVLDSPELVTPIGDGRAPDLRETNWTVAMSIGVDADTQRIFQALTVPEYLEAWINLPDRTEAGHVVAAQDGNGYRLDHYSPGRAAVRITGSYVYCHRRKMRLCWRKSCQQTCSESLVDFRLRGNFGSSILELRHSALESADEFLWHQKLWEGSLGKLASLLRSA
jgi:uncharacterized protein YndB with AHSA1/START domain